ncbi:hypothetical protein H4Q26_006055 [Puccinia striiformis f. sp. tritici PST-130]|nr:hypothetical protein H4Q26_006055 [Puccinia striiformis f. sp. tritici PST-130]
MLHSSPEFFIDARATKAVATEVLGEPLEGSDAVNDSVRNGYHSTKNKDGLETRLRELNSGDGARQHSNCQGWLT